MFHSQEGEKMFKDKSSSIPKSVLIYVGIVTGALVGILSNDGKKSICVGHSNLENVKSCLQTVESELFSSMFVGALYGIGAVLLILLLIWILEGEQTMDW
jgi:hypothetical protein